MKKRNSKFEKPLKIRSSKILFLNSQQTDKIVAGGETLPAQPVSFDCIPPYNAPPYFYPTRTN